MVFPRDMVCLRIISVDTPIKEIPRIILIIIIIIIIYLTANGLSPFGSVYNACT